LLPAAAVTVVIVAALGTRPAKSSPALAIGALIVTVAVIALFTGTVVKLAAEVWGGQAGARTAAILVPVPLLGVTALYFELRRVAAADLSGTRAPPHLPAVDTLPPGRDLLSHNRVAEVVVVCVRFRVSFWSRSNPWFLALWSGSAYPLGVRGGVGVVIDHPPLSFAFNGGGQ
jgi:hypothetical protein